MSKIRLNVQYLDERITPNQSGPEPPASIEGIMRHPASEQPPAPGTNARATWDLMESFGAYNALVQQFQDKLLLASNAYADYLSLQQQVIEQDGYIDELIANNAPAAQLTEARAILNSLTGEMLATKLGYNGFRSDLERYITSIGFAIGDMNQAASNYQQAYNNYPNYIIPQEVPVSIPSNLPSEIS